MTTIQNTFSDPEKKKIDELLFKSQVTKNVSSYIIKTEIDKDGALVFPNGIPNDVKKWIKKG